MRRAAREIGKAALPEGLGTNFEIGRILHFKSEIGKLKLDLFHRGLSGLKRRCCNRVPGFPR